MIYLEIYLPITSQSCRNIWNIDTVLQCNTLQNVNNWICKSPELWIYIEVEIR